VQAMRALELTSARAKISVKVELSGDYSEPK
jgi:hypothetical protein